MGKRLCRRIAYDSGDGVRGLRPLRDSPQCLWHPRLGDSLDLEDGAGQGVVRSATYSAQVAPAAGTRLAVRPWWNPKRSARIGAGRRCGQVRAVRLGGLRCWWPVGFEPVSEVVGAEVQVGVATRE